MSDELKNKIIESLKTQEEIFGDDLFSKKTPDNNMQSTEIVFSVAEKTETFNEQNLFMEDWQKSENLDELYELTHTCQKCPLGKTRNKFVFGVGNPQADAMLIGEAPGADEDAQGIPFVGRAGKLLTDILKAINFSRDEIYIANILKCRPPNNRDPLPEERETCIPYLEKQVELIKPKIILCLGKVAANTLLNNNLSLTKLRENLYEYNGIKMMATYHPAALLRNPNWKRPVWEDVQKFRKIYDELIKKA
ncbi:MAG: uracil-DNA glycosylase [Melioribacteraceae bacterium]|nr:uracil-DNA glycosylase [Melioribacteraceae bacterium]MCF8353276.1 uracil-DNA glycosylase [Melioribacteraceae bacterium]MCF8394838.1 uracil-DNA glycosylase [Melioribacteraceae bacterium]MCF8418803.1 uracil-DNA glycosylase [Melioribacteraceae bacterium]